MFSYLFLPTSCVIHLVFIVLPNHRVTKENISDKLMLIQLREFKIGIFRLYA